MPKSEVAYPASTFVALFLASVVARQVGRPGPFWQNFTTLFLVAAWQRKRVISTGILSVIDSRVSAWLSLLLVALAASFTLSLRQKSVDSNKILEPSETSFLKPMIFPCRTTHTRFFPTKHSFGYSYLFVGVPVGWHGPAGTLLSTNTSSGSSTWFSVHAADYLQRRSVKIELRSKLDQYLKSQQIDPDRYPHAYLVTAPRFLGFSFNPVSFWYLYDVHKRFSAMILEVNNTFDERRMYFMESQKLNNDSDDSFTNEWAKDFHVSPFNDRAGSYSLTAKNPTTTREGLQVDNNIVLRSAEGKPKIVARVFSTEPALDPSTSSWLHTNVFLLKWWWVGFVTNLRILWEARILWSKKLQVFYRPEVVRTSIGRNENAVEAQLEIHFRAFLQHLVDKSTTSFSLSYTPAAGLDRGTPILITQTRNMSVNTSANTSHVELVVLTPEFYAELVRHRTIEEIFRHSYFQAVEGGAMLYISDQVAFKTLLDKHAIVPIYGNPLRSPQVLFRASVFERMPRSNKNGEISWTFAISEIDSFVYSSNPELYSRYTRNAARVLCVDRLALGIAPLFDLETFALRLVSLYWILHLLNRIDERHHLSMFISPWYTA